MLFGSLIARGETKIAPDDKRIVIEGAMHLACADDRMTIDRFSSEMWQRPDLNNFSRSKALTQSGVRICFKTDSRTVKPLFSDREGADLRKPSNFTACTATASLSVRFRAIGSYWSRPARVPSNGRSFCRSTTASISKDCSSTTGPGCST